MIETESDVERKSYLSRLRILSFSSSSSFDRLYLSHSALIFSSKPPKVMNVTTISGRSWTALQATPQSGLKHPVIDASYHDQLNYVRKRTPCWKCH